MSKILAVFGTRPQFLKVGALWRVLKDLHEPSVIFVDSGQHYSEELSTVFRDQLTFPDAIRSLDASAGMRAPSAAFSTVVRSVGSLVLEARPAAVMVFGDTNTTLAAAVGAVAEGIPVVHVEAGLRSHDHSMPEELNRRGTDHLSRWLLTPTQAASDQLAREGISADRVRLVGDLTLDLFDALYRPQKTSGRGRILVTAHRAGNVDDPVRLRNLLGALATLAQDIDVDLRFFVHPRTKMRMSAFGLKASPAITLLPPVGYLEILDELAQSSLVITDSGGLQKDAAFAGKPCVVYRDVTEWTELVGSSVWLANDRDSLVAEGTRLFGSETHFDRNLYGNGRAGSNICRFLAEVFAQ